MKNRRETTVIVCIVAALFSIALVVPAHAAWQKIGPDVRITNDAAWSNTPSLVWAGSEYGVCWEDSRDGNMEIYFARLDASGAKIDGDVRITNAAGASSSPSLVWTGTEYGVSWKDYRDLNYEIYFARIDASGAKIDADVRVTNATGNSLDPSLVWAGTEYGVIWHEDRDGNWEIYFARIDASGAKIGGDVRITNNVNSSAVPSIVWTGTEYGVSWHEVRDGNEEIYFTRIDASGAKIGGDIRLTNDAGDSLEPSLVWTGTEYGVSWRDYRDGDWNIYFARIDATGAKIGGDVRITNDAGTSSVSSLVWAGTEYGVSWYDSRDGNWEIYFARIDASGAKIGGDVRITNNTGSSAASSLVRIGTRYGVTWYDDTAGNPEIYFASIGDPDAVTPTLSEWVMIFLGGLLLLALGWRMRKAHVVRQTGSLS